MNNQLFRQTIQFRGHQTTPSTSPDTTSEFPDAIQISGQNLSFRTFKINELLYEHLHPDLGLQSAGCAEGNLKI